MSAARKKSKRRGRKASVRERLAGLGVKSVLLIVLGTIGLAWLGIETAPRIVRQVVCQIGMRRVESHTPILRKVALESGVDSCLLAGVMYVESRGQVHAVSPKGAMGLFQLMPAAAADSARKLKIPTPTREQLLSDAELNARLGAEYLRWLIAVEGPNLERVLVSYNAGRGKLARWEKEAGGWERWRERQQVSDPSGAFHYALDVLQFRDRFRSRGVVAGAVDGVHAQALDSAPQNLGLPKR